MAGLDKGGQDATAHGKNPTPATLEDASISCEQSVNGALSSILVTEPWPAYDDESACDKFGALPRPISAVALERQDVFTFLMQLPQVRPTENRRSNGRQDEDEDQDPDQDRWAPTIDEKFQECADQYRSRS